MPSPAPNLGICKLLTDETILPSILVHKIVTPDDVEKLFSM